MCFCFGISSSSEGTVQRVSWIVSLDLQNKKNQWCTFHVMDLPLTWLIGKPQIPENFSATLIVLILVLISSKMGILLEFASAGAPKVFVLIIWKITRALLISFSAEYRNYFQTLHKPYSMVGDREILQQQSRVKDVSLSVHARCGWHVG